MIKREQNPCVQMPPDEKTAGAAAPVTVGALNTRDDGAGGQRLIKPMRFQLQMEHLTKAEAGVCDILHDILRIFFVSCVIQILFLASQSTV